MLDQNYVREENAPTGDAVSQGWQSWVEVASLLDRLGISRFELDTRRKQLRLWGDDFHMMYPALEVKKYNLPRGRHGNAFEPSAYFHYGDWTIFGRDIYSEQNEL